MKALRSITALFAIMSFMAYQGVAQNKSANTTQTNAQVTQTSTNAAPGNFVDNNKDGVCDNYKARIKNAGQGRGNPKGCGLGNQHRHGHGQGDCRRGGNGYQHRHGQGNQNPPATGAQKLNDKN